MPAVYLAAKQQLRAWPALGIANAYALFWGIQQMVFFDFHEIAFAVPLIAWALFALQKQFWALYAFCCLGLLFTKEDVSLLVAAFGILLIARRQWWPGVTSVLVGLTWFEVVTRILIPHFAGGQYAHWTYDQFGPDAVSAASKAITHPIFTIHELFSPRTKLKTVWYLFHPWLLLPFLSPLTWLTVPLIAARFFGQVPAWCTTGFHYNASIAPILAVATADGLRRLSGWFPKRITAIQNGGALAIITVAVVTLHSFPLNNLFHLKYYQLSQSERTGMQAVQLIPAKAPVTAQGSIISHLSERDRIETLDHGASGLAYLITSETTGTYPLPDSTVVKQVLQETLAKHHYERIFNHGGWSVYRIVN